jgi:creatinine amidohydrolase
MGISPHHMSFPGTITLKTTTFALVLKEVCQCLWQHGFRKILLLNGHGGNMNPVRSVAADLYFEDNIRVVSVSYWDFVISYVREWRKSSPGGINHACEMETALMLYLAGELVKKDQINDSKWVPSSKYLTGDLTIPGVVATPFKIDELNPEGVVGAPSAATAEKGKELFIAVTEKVAEFIREFYQWDWVELAKQQSRRI